MKIDLLAGCLALLLTTAGCGSESKPHSGESWQSSQRSKEEAAQEAARSALSDETFSDVGDTSLCTDDCGGHDAGWEWVKENKITSDSDCSGNASFYGGCEAYVEELHRQTEQYLDSEDIDSE